MTGLANLAVKVADLDRACDFYEAAGATVRDRMEWGGGERADVFLGPVMITLFTRAIYEDAVDLPAEGFLHPALFTDDLDAELEGHQVLWGPAIVEGTFGKRRIAFVDAPGGIRLEFMEQLEEPGDRTSRSAGPKVGAMEMRTLGGTGIKVSPLCFGAMMLGAWGNPDHDESVRIIHRALDAGINFVDTADVYSAGESEEIVGKALASVDRSKVVLATKVSRHDGEGSERRGELPPLDRRRVREQPPSPRDGLHRPLPDPPAGSDGRRRPDARRPDRPGPRRQDPRLRELHLPRRADRRGPVGRRPTRARTVHDRAAAVFDPRAGDRTRRAPGRAGLSDGRALVEPARGWLAVRSLRRGQGEHQPPLRDDPRSLRPLAGGQQGEARAGHRARRAGRRGGPHCGRPCSGLRARASGGHLGDHRAAHDGAARDPARCAVDPPSRIRCSIGSTRSCRRAPTSTPPTPARRRPP